MKRWRSLALGLAATLAVSVAAADSGDGRVPRPKQVAAKGERCVEDTEFMRRNHMSLLKHQRDETVHKGVRQAKHSLQGCVDCHAGASGTVAGAKDDFCQGCHGYASVKLDCFECHTARPRPAGRAAPTAMTPEGTR